MLDLNIPTYVWVIVCMILVLREIRAWYVDVLDLDMREQEFKHECEQDAKDNNIPESVKRMFS